MASGLTVQGLEELRRKLEKLTSGSVRRRVLRKGTRASSTPIRKAIRAAAPVGKTRNLKRSIDRRFKFYGRSGTDVSVIGPQIDLAKGYKGFIGWIIEHGTKERTVKDSFGRYKRGLVKRPIPMKVGKVTANPFAKRATDAVIKAAGEIGADALRKGLENEVRKLRGGG